VKNQENQTNSTGQTGAITQPTVLIGRAIGRFQLEITGASADQDIIQLPPSSMEY